MVLAPVRKSGRRRDEHRLYNRLLCRLLLMRDLERKVKENYGTFVSMIGPNENFNVRKNIDSMAMTLSVAKPWVHVPIDVSEVDTSFTLLLTLAALGTRLKHASNILPCLENEIKISTQKLKARGTARSF